MPYVNKDVIKYTFNFELSVYYVQFYKSINLRILLLYFKSSIKMLMYSCGAVDIN